MRDLCCVCVSEWVSEEKINHNKEKSTTIWFIWFELIDRAHTDDDDEDEKDDDDDGWVQTWAPLALTWLQAAFVEQVF